MHANGAAINVYTFLGDKSALAVRLIEILMDKDSHCVSSVAMYVKFSILTGTGISGVIRPAQIPGPSAKLLATLLIKIP